MADNGTTTVDSAAVKNFRFTDRGLIVGFTNGSVYVYPDVSAEEHAVLAVLVGAKKDAPEAISFGGYFHRAIRAKYRAERLL